MATAVETQAYSRNKLVASLMQIKHGDLSLYIPDGLAAAKADPDILAHFIAWNQKNGKVRDAKVALPPLALRGLAAKDADLAENAVAHMLSLSPRDLVRAYDFSKALTKDGKVIPGGHRRLLESGLKLYLEQREGSQKWFDKTVLQHRRSMKQLYRLSHKKPSPHAQAILFDHRYPKHSVFTKVAQLRTMGPKEAAGVILEYQIPFEVAVGAVSKAKDKDIVLALLEGMTGNQVITNTQMFQRLGVMTDSALKAAYDKAIERAKADGKVETLKAGRAARQVKGTTNAAKLEDLQQVKTAQLGTIEGDWLVLGDCSGSMEKSMEVARHIASIIAERVSGAVYLVFFDTSPTYFDITGKSYTEVVEITRRVTAGGATSIGCGLDYIRSRGIVVNGIAIASDGGENRAPTFSEVYKKYCQALAIEPPVYFFHVPGDGDALSRNMAHAGIQLEQFELGSNVDYYSLPNIVKTLRANRYALYDEIMETPLLKFADVFRKGAGQ